MVETTKSQAWSDMERKKMKTIILLLSVLQNCNTKMAQNLNHRKIFRFKQASIPLYWVFYSFSVNQTNCSLILIIKKYFKA